MRTGTDPRRPSERGAVAVLFAVAMTVMLIAVGMVLDFGLARVDRQTSKAVADTSVAAGLRGLDSGDGRILSYKGACAALDFVKVNQPAVASLDWAACSNATLLARECSVTDAATHASYSGTANGITVEIRAPYRLTGSGWPEESTATSQNDQLTAADACRQIAVVISRARKPGFGSLAGANDLTTSVRSVGRVTVSSDTTQAVALLLLDRTNCDAIVINGVNSFVNVLANGQSSGLIHSDSDASACSGGARVFVGDHPNGIKAFASAGAPGVIRNRAVGTTNASRSQDSTINVVAEGGAPVAGPLVTRKPVDDRYIVGGRAAVVDYQTEALTLGNSSGYTKRQCGDPAAQLQAVTGKLWIQCSASTSFSTPNVTLQASTVFFDAKSVSANNLSMPNATRVYISGDTSTNGNGLSVNSTSFRMNQGGATTCPPPPTGNRARLVIGAGGITTNSSSTLQLCATTVVLRGGDPGGCIPTTLGVAPLTVSCQGRLSLGGSIDWSAPNQLGTGATAADWLDLEDLALYSEASGTHTISGGGGMRLSGIFFLPNGDFKLNGGSTQDIRNSQYVARTFTAGGGSVLEMQPNPPDVVGLPVLTYSMVR